MRQFIIDVLFITAIVYAMLWLALYQWDVDEMVEPTTFYDGVEIQPSTYRYVPKTITTECDESCRGRVCFLTPDGTELCDVR